MFGVKNRVDSLLSHRRHLISNIFSLYSLQGLNYLIPMAVLPYLIRVLGVEKYGVIAYSQAFTQYFVLFTDYGFNFSGTRYISQHRDSLPRIQAQFWRIMIIKILLALVGFIVLMSLLYGLPQFNRYSIYFACSYLSVLGSVLLPQWYFQGLEHMRQIAVITGLAKIFSATLLFVFVRQPEHAVLAVILQSGGLLLAGVIGFCVALRGIGFQFIRPSFNELRSTLQDGWHLFISTAAVSLYTNTNLVLVGLLAGTEQVGYFSAVEKLVRAVAGLITPITQALFPHITLLITQSREKALQSIRRLLKWMGIGSLAFSLAILLAARPLAATIAGHNAAAGCVPVMYWIAFLPFLTAVSNVLGTQTMIPFGFDKQFSYILIASGCLNLLTAIPLIYFWRATGAGISVLIAESFVTAAMLLFLRREKFEILCWGKC